jgi:hypothetical protein
MIVKSKDGYTLPADPAAHLSTAISDLLGKKNNCERPMSNNPYEKPISYSHLSYHLKTQQPMFSQLPALASF